MLRVAVNLQTRSDKTAFASPKNRQVIVKGLAVAWTPHFSFVRLLSRKTSEKIRAFDDVTAHKPSIEF